MKKIMYVALLLAISCSVPEENKKKNITDNLNESTVFSDNVDKLSQILDFSEFKPTTVQFKYSSIGSVNNRVPGPTDYYLEALLIFDKTTMDKIRDKDKEKEYDNPNYKKEMFLFEWLTNDVKEELLNSKSDYYGHPDFYFRKVNCKSWYLKDKILLRWYST